MSDVTEAVQRLREFFATVQYPEGFLEKYDQMECLSSHRGQETFMVREKSGQELLIAKCYDKSVYGDAHGSVLLQTLRHQSLPSFADVFENECMVCVVREYIRGTPLDQYAARHKPSRNWIVPLCVRLCDVLAYLHEKTPPIIHRDIKPQNIIVRSKDCRQMHGVLSRGTVWQRESGQESLACRG